MRKSINFYFVFLGQFLFEFFDFFMSFGWIKDKRSGTDFNSIVVFCWRFVSSGHWPKTFLTSSCSSNSQQESTLDDWQQCEWKWWTNDKLKEHCENNEKLIELWRYFNSVISGRKLKIFSFLRMVRSARMLRTIWLNKFREIFAHDWRLRDLVGVNYDWYHVFAYSLTRSVCMVKNHKFWKSHWKLF